MTSPIRQIIKNKLDEFKEIKVREKKKIWYTIEITFDSIEFNKHFSSVDSFWRLLTTNFFGPDEYKKSNHSWFNSLEPEGFFFFTETFKLVQFRIYLETKIKIDFEEFGKRVEEISPFIELSYSFKDEFEFNKMFANDIFAIQKSEIQYIGNAFTSYENDETEDLPF
jgi:hypothetical protein